jgi:hypothetical protein
VIGVHADDVGLDLQRHRRHRQHPALGPEQRADHVQPGHRIAQAFPQTGDQQVPDGVVAERAGAFEAVLQHVRPGPPGLVVTAQGRQRHPEVTGRETVELLAEPAGGAAVVGHRHDRGQPVGDPAQRGQ